MRVYELAKELELSNKELINRFQALGVAVKSHSSSVDDKSVRLLMDRIKEDEARKEEEAAERAREEERLKKARRVLASGERVVARRRHASHDDEEDHAEGDAGAEADGQADSDDDQATGAKLDARAIALQKIQQAKAKRQRQQEQREKQARETKAPEHQEINLAGRAPAAPPEPPKAPAAQPKTETVPKAAPPQPQGRKRAPEPEPVKAPPRRPAPKPEPQRPLQVRRENLELEQLPGLPQRKAPPAPRQEPERPVELTVPPSIDVMKLKPAKRPVRRDDDDDKRRKRPAAKQPSRDRKTIRPGRFLNVDTIEDTVAGSDRRGIRPRTNVLSGDSRRPAQKAAGPKEPAVVKIHGDVTVAEFAANIKVEPAEVIMKAMGMGEMLSMNQMISADMSELLAGEFGVKIEIVPESDENDVAELLSEEGEPDVQPRPPVVTVMGHVDHGKTTLLDSIRNTRVVDGEFGGITQHIGAYRVQTDRGEVVFLDTPGHAAFTAMRARGASVTDIVILIVAADDGLMPQTVEAINHAKSAGVPIIVAINKMDLPGANPQRVKNDLMQHELIGEEFGGETIVCEVSALKGDGVENLLEMVALQAEIMELKADVACRAQGIVIESEVDPQRGVCATVLVQKGVLHHQDPFVCGDVSGSVRMMLDDRGNSVEEARPSYPVEILGFSACPQVGEPFVVCDSERQAREIAEKREDRRQRISRSDGARGQVTLEGLSEYLNEDDKPKELNLIIKADVQGSVEAVSQAVQGLSTEKVAISVVHAGVGAVTESDIQLALAADALLVGFNVRPDSSAADMAEAEGISISTYRVIYELLEELKLAMTGMLDKKYREQAQATVEVRQIFRISRYGNIAGCYVTKGTLSRNDKVRLVRDGVVVYEGSLASLRRVKDDVNTVQAGYECGLTLTDFQDVHEGDVIESYRMEEVEQVL